MNSDSQARQAGSCISRPSKWRLARLGVGQRHALVAARGPAAHRGVGDVHVELQRIGRAAVAEGLHRKRIALGQHHRLVRQVEALAMPLIDVVGPVLADRAAFGGRPDRVIADLGVAVGVLVDPGAEPLRQHLRAEADAEKRLLLLQRHADPVDLAPDDLVVVVGALRPAENDGAAVGFAASWAARRRTAAGARRAGCRGCEAGSRPGPAWKALRAGRSGSEGASGSKAHGVRVMPRNEAIGVPIQS